jgi:hypothetical protein
MARHPSPAQRPRLVLAGSVLAAAGVALAASATALLTVRAPSRSRR